MTETEYQEIEQAFEFDVYPKRNVTLVRGKNALMWDTAGNEYIDCVSGHGASNLGHGNEAVLAAIRAQSERLITCSNVFYNDQRALLLQKLVEIAPDSLVRAFLCNSGTEAIEAALKFARFTTKKTDFICAMRGFHGRTYGALSGTFKLDYRADFEPVVPGFGFVPFNNIEKLRAALTQRTAAIVLELVQGEGGVNIGDEAYFRAVRKLCDERGILLIIDEVQTGFCRTGKMFACEHFDLRPDIMCVAKAIAGGLPMGAVLCSSAVAIPVGKHGTTFGGNPLCCAAAIATLDYMIEHKLAERAMEKGDHFRERVSAKPLGRVREIRSLGLMIGLELKEKVLPVVLQLLDDGLLAFPAGATVLRVFPPLTIERDVWDRAIEKIIRVLR